MHYDVIYLVGVFFLFGDQFMQSKVNIPQILLSK
jgi:hypothetical protein